MTKKRKFWAIEGVLRSGEETPRCGEGPCKAKVLAAVKDPHVAARPRGKVCPASGSPRRSHYSQHGNVVFLFRFVFPLFRRLVYWTNKDPISV